jgi:hypothetical protein
MVAMAAEVVVGGDLVVVVVVMLEGVGEAVAAGRAERTAGMRRSEWEGREGAISRGEDEGRDRSSAMDSWRGNRRPCDVVVVVVVAEEREVVMVMERGGG